MSRCVGRDEWGDGCRVDGSRFSKSWGGMVCEYHAEHDRPKGKGRKKGARVKMSDGSMYETRGGGLVNLSKIEAREQDARNAEIRRERVAEHRARRKREIAEARRMAGAAPAAPQGRDPGRGIG